MSVSTGLGGGLISGTPTGITWRAGHRDRNRCRWGDRRNFLYDLAGRFNSAQAPVAAPSASREPVTPSNAEGYTVTTLATVQMAATTYWSDGSTLDVTSMATWACTPSPQCGSVSASGLYTTGNSVGTYHVTATLSGVTNNGGSGVAVTVATIQAHTKESDRVANSGMVMRGRPATAEWHTRRGATEGRMRHRCAFNPQVRCWRWWKLRARRNDLPRGCRLSRAVERSVNDGARRRRLWLAGRRAGHGLCSF